MKAIVRHIVLEMWGCQNLESVEVAEQALREMVDALDVHLLDLKVYPFSPVGVTGMAIVSESHLVIHTWPEYGYAAVDVFTCGAPREPQAAVTVLREHYQPERVQVMEITRGQLDLDLVEKDRPNAAPSARAEEVRHEPVRRQRRRVRAPALTA